MTFRTKAVECEKGLNWYHKDCGGISHELYKSISEKFGSAKCERHECERRECELTITGVKIFLPNVDDIVRTVKGDPSVLLQAANKSHPKLQFKLETLNENVDLADLDFNINVGGNKQVK